MYLLRTATLLTFPIPGIQTPTACIKQRSGAHKDVRNRQIYTAVKMVFLQSRGRSAVNSLCSCLLSVGTRDTISYTIFQSKRKKNPHNAKKRSLQSLLKRRESAKKRLYTTTLYIINPLFNLPSWKTSHTALKSFVPVQRYNS